MNIGVKNIQSQMVKHEEKIVTIAHSYGKLGGHTRHLELALGAVQHDKDVLWIAPSEARFEIKKIKGVRFGEAICLPFNLPVIQLLFRTSASLFKFKGEINGSTLCLLSEFDIISYWMVKNLINPRKVVFLQRSDLVEKTKFLINHNKNLKRLRLRCRLKLLRFIYGKLARHIDLIIVQTPHHIQRLKNIGVKTDIELVCNNINPSWVFADKLKKSSIPINSNYVNFVVVANLFYLIKGFDFLFKTLNIIPEHLKYTVTIIGDGPDASLIRGKIIEYGLGDKVKMAGKVDNASLEMCFFDGIIIPSPYDDCPNVVLEAISAGIPVLATEIDAHEYLLGENFPLIKIDSEFFAFTIEDFINDEGVFRSSLIPKERQAELSFDWSKEILNVLFK